jgi:hypothetical protein
MSKTTSFRTAITSRGNVRMTRHGSQREAQRSIPPFIVDALIDFGDERYLGDKCRSYSFGKASWKRYAKYMGKAIAGHERFRHVYLVVAPDNSIVTVAWRH